MSNKLIRSIKDIFFDFPFSHDLKNKSRSILSQNKSFSNVPNVKRTHRNYFLIYKEPIVIITSEQIIDLQLFSEQIGKKNEVTFLVYFWWTLFDNFSIFDEIIYQYKIHCDNFPNHKIIFLLNSKKEHEIFKSKGVKSEFIHQNALVDINLFKPLKQKKKYDVVYNGRLEELKRHYLLKDCQKIGIISAHVMNIDRSKEEYLNELKKNIPHAFVINSNLPISMQDFQFEMGFKYLTSKQVNVALNQSKIGVILSSKEGACYASIEYLLAGIPVVSTKNIGGRDYFLDNRFCRIVSSNPKAIKNAVDELISLNVSP
ncbi:glycosyltransferase, partial [Candidatus Marinimicrobia bacterium]|nr:glycosyltransferase [Candidatus Neomarinimicrobiota bacterium]